MPESLFVDATEFADATNVSQAVSWAFIGTLFVLGACIGSFLNVVIYRVPMGLSIVSPPSRCPNCETLLRPADNIPVVSWLLLRGRCRHCSVPISARYPVVELITAVLFARIGWLAIQQHTLEALLSLSGVVWFRLALRLTAASSLVVAGFWNWDHARVPVRFPMFVAAIGTAQVLAAVNSISRLSAIVFATMLVSLVCFVECRFNQRANWRSALTAGALGGMLMDRAPIGLALTVATLARLVFSLPSFSRNAFASRLTWPVLASGSALIIGMQPKSFVKLWPNPWTEVISTSVIVVVLSLLTQTVARRKSLSNTNKL